MFVLIITDDYDFFTNFTDNKIDDANTIIKSLLLSIPGIIKFLSVVGLLIFTTPKLLITNK